MIKKAVWFFILLAVILVYLFWTDFGLIKKLIGSNAPTPAESPSVSPDGELSFLNLPEGLKISVVAKDLEGPRVIVFDANGRMLVSETKAGRVSILEDPVRNSLSSNGASKDIALKTRRTLIDGLKSPHGSAFYQDEKTKTLYLYIAETHQVARYPYNLKTGRLLNPVGENITNLPAEGRHFTRTIAFGPNFRKSPILKGGNEAATLSQTKLYISIGSSCDVCEENSWKRAAILESDPEGTFTAEFAGGLRNAVFFTFHPETREIWATEMGRDNLGDNLPPDEVNIVKVAETDDKFGARRYGWPFCYGNKVKDKTFNPDKFGRVDIPQDCGQTESAVIELPAHSAPLGLAFVPEDGEWPKDWRGDLLVAYHGSWNRSIPTGYKIVRVEADKNGKVSKTKDFISGWLATNNQILGRPVDLKFGPDGALYVSDDAAGLIYKIQPR